MCFNASSALIFADALPVAAKQAVGFHYASSWVHKVEMAAGLETDPSGVLNEILLTVRKGGRVSVVGVYVGKTNHLNIGCFLEKGLTMKAGQTPVQRYWEMLLAKVQKKVGMQEMPWTFDIRPGVLCVAADSNTRHVPLTHTQGAGPAHRHHARDAAGGGGGGVQDLQRQEGTYLLWWLERHAHTYLHILTYLHHLQDGCVKVVLHPKSYPEDYSGMREETFEREASL